MATDIRNLSLKVIKRAIVIKKKIAALENELVALFGGTPGKKASRLQDDLEGVPVLKKARKKRKMSPEGRARIIAAQKARWAKVKGTAKK